MNAAHDRGRGPRKLVLCFDGTGNKFHGDEGDSNILKIFRMLDRTAGDQYHYYQRKWLSPPSGIGTYVVSKSLTHTSVRARVKSWYLKAKDSAVGSSFDYHVVGGYRFMMRFYSPGDEIYMFGFSRGAYIARFLAEMLDHIGLLSHGNEEMVTFAWKAFAQWQSRRQTTGAEGDEEVEVDEKTHKMHEFMKSFRETFSRPVGRINFLGLFDTVNSVPRFETAWMKRSKFPYTARSSARVIRHAVSIDERRAKFRQDLMYQTSSSSKRHHRHRRPHVGQLLLDPFRRSVEMARASSSHRPQTPSTANKSPRDRSPAEKSGAPAVARSKTFLSPGDEPNHSTNQRRLSISNPSFAPYRPRAASRTAWDRRQADQVSCASGLDSALDYDGEGTEEQDIEEVWFAGGHGDIGGGWKTLGDSRGASHVPLAWIVREAMKAGLPFDMDKVVEMGCFDAAADQFQRPTRVDSRAQSQAPDIRVQDETVGGGQEEGQTDKEGHGEGGFASSFHGLMHKAHTWRIHDSLEYGGGLSLMAVTAWKCMEWLPFQRMDLQADGSWKPIRWPLPRGEVRDIPANVHVHGSVIRRLKEDEKYRPGNLIIGGGGRGVRCAPPEYGIGEWVCIAEHGDPVGELWMRKERNKEANGR